MEESAASDRGSEVGAHLPPPFTVSAVPPPPTGSPEHLQRSQPDGPCKDALNLSEVPWSRARRGSELMSFEKESLVSLDVFSHVCEATSVTREDN